MALIRAEDFLKTSGATETKARPSGGLIRASDFLGTTPAGEPSAPVSLPKPVAGPSVTPSIAPTVPIKKPFVTPQQPIAPPKDVDVSALIRPTGFKASPTGLTQQEIAAKAIQSGDYAPTLPDLRLEKAQTARERVGEKARRERLKVEEKSLQDQLAEINKRIGIKADPAVVQEQTKLQAELQDVSAELHPATLGIAEGLSELLPSTKTFTEAQQERREIFGAEPSVGIEKARETTAFKAGSAATQLAGNVLLYSGINQAMEGVGAASKLGKLLGLATKTPKGQAIATFAGTQGADLLVDTMAQLPEEVIESIVEDETLSEATKKILTNRAIDAGINLVIGGFISKDMLQQAFKKVDPTLIPDSTKRLADQMGVEVKTIQQELGIPEGMNYEQFMRGQKDLARTIGEEVARKGKPTYKSFPEYFSNTFSRNIKNTFGEGSTGWKTLVEPLEAAKKKLAFDVDGWAKELDRDIVKGFGIAKSSPESAAVQKIGEGVITLDQLKAEFPTKWKDISKAADWFRSRYDEILKDVNKARTVAYGPGKEIPARQDYFRHMSEISGTQTKIKSIFERDAEGAANLFKGGDYIKPEGKTASFMKERKGDKTIYDAVGGYLNYIPMAGYAKHIDPYTKQVRDFTKIFRSSAKPESAEPFVKYLDDFADQLSGKPSAFQTRFGDSKTFKAIKAINSRAKSNAVLFNLATTAMQTANIPVAMAKIQDPESLVKGMYDFMGSAFGGGHKSLYDQSGFLKERFGDKLLRSFDTKLKDQPGKFSRWLLEVNDEIATKYIWSSAYEKALKTGELDPITYADRIAKDSVAGRGVGDIPMLHKSAFGQAVMPFTIEVANELAVRKEFWQDIGAGLKGKDLRKAKQGAVGLLTLYMGNHLFNNMMEEITGFRPKFDPVDVFRDTASDPETGIVEFAGRMAGEHLESVPGGGSLARVYPEFGIGGITPSREELFGKSDPTRFGEPFLALSAIKDPARYLLPPAGGSQIAKTLRAARSANILPFTEELPVTGLYTRDFEKLKKPVDFTPGKLAKSLAFGTGALPESREFYEQEQRQLSERQTDAIRVLQDEHNIPAKDAVDFLQAVRSANADSKKEWTGIMKDFNFSAKERRSIMDELFPKK